MSNERNCKNCAHYVVTDSRTNWNGEPPTMIYGCEKWECEYEPKKQETEAKNEA